MCALATERTLTYMFSHVYVLVLCHIQIMSICLSDLTESIINSFDCVRRKELLPLRGAGGAEEDTG